MFFCEIHTVCSMKPLLCQFLTHLPIGSTISIQTFIQKRKKSLKSTSSFLLCSFITFLNEFQKILLLLMFTCLSVHHRNLECLGHYCVSSFHSHDNFLNISSQFTTLDSFYSLPGQHKMRAMQKFSSTSSSSSYTHKYIPSLEMVRSYAYSGV